MPISPSTWSTDRIEQLRRCFNAGLTCSQIAREIGVTRNAVIGKMNRMGLSRPRDVLSAQMRRAAKLARAKPERNWRRLSIIAQRKMLRDAYPEETQPEEIPIYNGRGCTLLELKQGQCRWPINEPGAENFCFCGNEAFQGFPYCVGHARLAYRSTRGA
jgi:GcrA cell cycle regulator